MAEKRDYYAVLEITRTSTSVEVKSAYRKMARKYHPDINREDHAEERFKEVNEAYEVLSNPERRAAYDRFGHAAAGAGAGAGDPFGGFGGGSPFSDLFDSFSAVGMGAPERLLHRADPTFRSAFRCHSKRRCSALKRMSKLTGSKPVTSATETA